MRMTMEIMVLWNSLYEWGLCPTVIEDGILTVNCSTTSQELDFAGAVSDFCVFLIENRPHEKERIYNVKVDGENIKLRVTYD